MSLAVKIIGGAMFFLNLQIAYLSKKMKWIGPTRGNAIGGWVSFLTGALLLYNQDLLNFLNINIALGMGVLSVIGVIFVFAGATAPQLYQTVFKYPINAFTTVGSFIGYVVGLLLAIFG